MGRILKFLIKRVVKRHTRPVVHQAAHICCNSAGSHDVVDDQNLSVEVSSNTKHSLVGPAAGKVNLRALLF